jgi:hypothetical protein
MALKSTEAQRIFNRIADRCDLMNRLMTMGRHEAWCHEVARRIQWQSAPSGRRTGRLRSTYRPSAAQFRGRVRPRRRGRPR